ncbi:GntR family transcriptional regulator [Pseudomonas putida]|uniref:GntR family transcriptional regulator n=1 Tax=Pseudomonas putida TaxID=303 RepID=UPI003F2BE000
MSMPENLETTRGPLTADAIAHTLREAILDGTIGVGVQLKQEALAKRFGVSRIPVREALKRLEAEGLVRHVARQGSVVAAKSIDELVETLDIRIALETRALRLAIPNLTDTDFAAAYEVLQRYEASEVPREWAELNLEFHTVLYRACNRPTLLKMIADTVKGIDLHLRVMQSYSVGRKSSMVDHSDILHACETRDIARAILLLEAHIEHTQTALLDGTSSSKLTRL